MKLQAGCSGWSVPMVAELVLRHFLALVNLLGVLAFGLLVDTCPPPSRCQTSTLLAVSAERFLRLVEDAHSLATSLGIDRRHDADVGAARTIQHRFSFLTQAPKNVDRPAIAERLLRQTVDVTVVLVGPTAAGKSSLGRRPGSALRRWTDDQRR